MQVQTCAYSEEVFDDFDLVADSECSFSKIAQEADQDIRQGRGRKEKGHTISSTWRRVPHSSSSSDPGISESQTVLLQVWSHFH